MLLLYTLTTLIGLVSAATFSNPLKSRDGSDPHIVYAEGYYSLMTTTWNDLRFTRAKTLEGLKTGESRIVYTDTNPARCCNVWAPELHNVTNTWYMYYTAGTRTTLDNQRSHVVRGPYGTSPWPAPGTSYTYAAQLTKDWGIDGTLLRLNSLTYFIYSWGWKVLSEPTLPWERVRNPVNKGAAALSRGNRTWVAYSASDCWTDSYQLGLLTYKGGGADPMLAGSWVKSSPVFSSANGNWGTGHNAFFTSSDGTEIWNVYHATAVTTGNCDGNRYTAAKRVEWRADGTPDFGRADARGTVLVGPSGE
ncbi:hypothetical protein QBC35DRAFT_525408 [Podospora australis]|uniref:Glycoside Hydrolase Family 43 n=1 Tax=Podospora australis TaxID=1536484 RepID=A0AAN6WQQ1_9PEZI|nr:hypothetical protein QBC35DRAFT_525408 [Podospora australis]